VVSLYFAAKKLSSLSNLVPRIAHVWNNQLNRMQCCYPHWKVREFDVGWKVVTVFAVQTDFQCTDKCVHWKDGIITLLPMYIIRPHRCATYVDAACCYRLSSVVWQSVCHNSEPCKNWVNRLRCHLVEGSGGPKEPWGSRSSHGNGQFWRGRSSHCKV